MVLNQFQEMYLHENVIPNSSIQRLVKMFEETGTVRDLPEHVAEERSKQKKWRTQ